MTITLAREEAQQVLDALQCATPPTFSAKIVEDWQSAVEFLRARLSAPEPEPVAWMHPDWLTYTRAPAPVVCYKENWTPLYTAPPQREWVGLRGEQIYEVAKEIVPKTLGFIDVPEWVIPFARAIEAKLKEKNDS